MPKYTYSEYAATVDSVDFYEHSPVATNEYLVYFSRTKKIEDEK